MIDAIWTVGLQVQVDAKSKKDSKEFGALAEFVRQLAKQGGLEVQGVMERLLDTDLLFEADIIPSVEGMEKKLKKINTDSVYRQQKYNLLREEVNNGINTT